MYRRFDMNFINKNFAPFLTTLQWGKRRFNNGSAVFNAPFTKQKVQRSILWSGVPIKHWCDILTIWPQHSNNDKQGVSRKLNLVIISPHNHKTCNSILLKKYNILGAIQKEHTCRRGGGGGDYQTKSGQKVTRGGGGDPKKWRHYTIMLYSKEFQRNIKC